MLNILNTRSIEMKKGICIDNAKKFLGLLI